MYEARNRVNQEKPMIRVIVNNVGEAAQLIAKTDKNLEIVIKENTATSNSDVIVKIDGTIVAKESFLRLNKFSVE